MEPDRFLAVAVTHTRHTESAQCTEGRCARSCGSALCVALLAGPSVLLPSSARPPGCSCRPLAAVPVATDARRPFCCGGGAAELAQLARRGCPPMLARRAACVPLPGGFMLDGGGKLARRCLALGFTWPVLFGELLLPPGPAAVGLSLEAAGSTRGSTTWACGSHSRACVTSCAGRAQQYTRIYTREYTRIRYVVDGIVRLYSGIVKYIIVACSSSNIEAWAGAATSGGGGSSLAGPASGASLVDETRLEDESVFQIDPPVPHMAHGLSSAPIV